MYQKEDWSVRNTTSGEFWRWLTTVYMKSIIASTMIILVDEKQTILTMTNVSQSVEARSTISWSAYQNFCTMERLSQISVDRRMCYVSRTDWILECDQWYVSSDSSEYFRISFTGIFYQSDPSLKLVAFLFNYFTCLPLHIWLFWQPWSVMADLWCSLVEALLVDLVKFLSEIFSASFQSVFCDPCSKLSLCFTDVYLFTLVAWFHMIRL